MRKISLFFVLSLLLSSCSMMEKTSGSVTTIKTRTSKVLDVYGNGVVYTPVIADLDVKSERVKGTAEGENNSVSYFKKLALADAIEKSGADILIEPNYITEVTGSKVSVIVTGYPATYKNFRSLKKEHIELLKAGTIQQPKQGKLFGGAKQGASGKKGAFGLGMFGL